MGFIHIKQVRFKASSNLCVYNKYATRLLNLFPCLKSLYAKYYFALRSIVEKQDFRQRYNRMVGRVDSVAQSEALKIQKRSSQVKEEAISKISRSM